MAVSTEALQEVERFCEKRIPEDRRREIRLDAMATGDAITLVELRPPWREDLGPEWTSQPIAQLRYDRGAGAWSLYWPRHTGRWVRYDDAPATNDVAPLLAVIHADPDGVFWG